MLSRQHAAIVAILALIAACTYGVVRTGGDAAPVAPHHSAVEGDSLAPTHEQSLAIAQRLVRQPTSADERPFAEDALRLGDKEMDLAFADAVRRLAIRPRTISPQVDSITAHVRQAQAELAADKAEVAALTAQVAAAPDSSRDALAERLNFTRAHMGLVQDELDDASGDLMRAGGDPQAQMQAMMAEHEAMSASSDSVHVNVTPVSVAHGLVHHAQAWLALDRKALQLAEAGATADSAATDFERQHDALEARRRARAANRTAPSANWASLLADTQRRALAQKTQNTLDQHVDNQHELVDVYGHWSDVVRFQKRHEVNQALRGLAMILGIVLVGLLLEGWLDRILERIALDQRRTQTLYLVLRVTMQVLGVMFILLIVFGMPDNLGTFLGLAGAGLTVALKDPILGFFGWFVLMGRDGIAIGDLVEINGVTGEVQELGMLHTVLLETGNWADSGHITGRRVTFSNSFAIEKHYFNFSTNGRWLWDDVRFTVPAGRNPSPIVAALQQEVERLTADSAARAEQELKGLRRAPRLQAISSAPTITVKPANGGVEVMVRYLTHVRERADVRARLYGLAIALLGDQPSPELPPSLPALAGALVR